MQVGNEKVRVLNIIGKRPTGGIGAVVYNYQSHFTTGNVVYDYLLFAEEPYGDFDDKVEKLGSKVYVLPELRNSRLIYLYKKINEFFKIHGSEYDVVHLHSTNIGFLCYPIAKKYGIKNLIAHSHATMYSDKKLNAIRNSILCLPLKKMANIYFACSRAAGEFLYGKRMMESGKVYVLNNAIDYDKFKFNDCIRNKIRRELGLDNKFVVGHVGRFCEQKNHIFLIDIFCQVIKHNRDSVLVLVGEGPLKEEIKKLVKERNIETNVLFLGQRSDVNELLQAMDVFVLPSLYEGLPVIGVEAQASGFHVFFRVR